MKCRCSRSHRSSAASDDELGGSHHLRRLDFERFARIEVERLAELRVAAMEERIDAELALGRHAVLVGELEALVAEHPRRERPRGQLMLALYRCVARLTHSRSTDPGAR